MRNPISLVLFALCLAPTASRALEGVHINRSATAPPVVVVEPGVQIVDGFNDEVYVSGGYYRCRSSPRICVSVTNGESSRSVHAALATASSLSRRMSR